MWTKEGVPIMTKICGFLWMVFEIIQNIFSNIVEAFFKLWEYIFPNCLNYLKWFIFLEGGNVLYPSCILVSSSFPRLAQIVGKLWAAHHYKYPICNKFELTIKMSYSYTMDPFISRLFIHNLSCSYTMDPFITRLFHPQSNPPLMVLKPTSQQL